MKKALAGCLLLAQSAYMCPTQLTQFLLFLQKLGVRCASQHVCAPKTFEALCKAMVSIEESMDTQSCMTRNSLRLKSGTFYAMTSE